MLECSRMTHQAIFFSRHRAKWTILFALLCCFVSSRNLRTWRLTHDTLRLRGTNRRKANQNSWIFLPGHSVSHTKLTSLVKCVGTPGFNETCLFRNMYWIQGEKYPTAIVAHNSSAHKEIQALAPVHLIGVYDITYRLPKISTITSSKDFQAPQAGFHFLDGLTVYFDSECPQSVGHGIWDGVWPIFVGLKQLGLPNDIPFQPIMHNVGRKNKKQFNLTDQITKAVALGRAQMFGEPHNLNSKTRPPPSGVIYRLGLFAMGSGHRGQRNMNREYSLPGGEFLQSFRDRTLQGFGLRPSQPLPFCSRRSLQSEGWNVTQIKLQVSIFDNKRYSTSEREAMHQLVKENEIAELNNSTGLRIRFVRWNDYTIAQQMELISQTDIYVSGPGTGIVFSPFARDGSVVINLGFWQSSEFQMTGYIDEYFVQGAPHQRGLFFDRCKHREVNKEALVDLLLQAENIVRSCEHFGEDKVAEENRSPIVKAMRELFDTLGPSEMQNLTKHEQWKLENDILRGSQLHNSPRGRYRLHNCDWAEHLVFATKRCRGIWKRYNWDKMAYIRTAAALRSKHGLSSGFCHFNTTVKAKID